MSLKLSKRLSSKKRKPIQHNAPAEVLLKLGLGAFGTEPLDLASMSLHTTWALDREDPLEPKDLPKSFLQRLWLLDPDARSACCKHPSDSPDSADKPSEETTNGFGKEGQCTVNPLDLVTAVFMSATTFLHQEMAERMVRCQFAVPLVLPHIDPEEPPRFLLWPFRAIVSRWRAHRTMIVREGVLASMRVPMISFVRLGRCRVSKSQVLNNLLSKSRPGSEMFLHRGMDGGQLSRRLCDGLVEIGWCIPTGDPIRDIFSFPLAICNLRGDAGAHQKCLSLVCQASSAVVVICGDLSERERLILASCNAMAHKLLLIDLAEAEKENKVVGFVGENPGVEMPLPEGTVLSGRGLNETGLANLLGNALKDVLSRQLQLTTLETAAKLAAEQGLKVDEGVVCKKAMASVDEVLKGFEKGPARFRQQQLPLQGRLWAKLSGIDKQMGKLMKEGRLIDDRVLKERYKIANVLAAYKMTPAMKIFTDALFTMDVVQRSYFLSWMKIRLRMLQSKGEDGLAGILMGDQTDEYDSISVQSLPGDGATDNPEASDDSFCTDTSEKDKMEEQRADADESVSNQDTAIEPDSNQVLETSAETRLQQGEPIASEEAEGSDDEEIQGEEVIEGQDQPNDYVSDVVADENNILSEFSQATTLSWEGKETLEPDNAPEQSNARAFDQRHVDQSATSEDLRATDSQIFESKPFLLGLEHFLREMGLIFELTHFNQDSGSHNVLRLPGIAADLILQGVPIELMDGDASNVPIYWLAYVFAELKRRLPPKHVRSRILTSLGVNNARNAEVLSALFGAKFSVEKRRSIRGVYMTILCVPDHLRAKTECEVLFLIDVEGLCSAHPDSRKNTQIQDNEMATLVTGLTDVLMHNISSHASYEFEGDLTVMVNALLRIKECGSMPIYHLLARHEDIYSKLQATQFSRIFDILQNKSDEFEIGDTSNNSAETASCISYVSWPWYDPTSAKSVDVTYGEALLGLKRKLFGAFPKCASPSQTSGLAGLLARLCFVWDAVREETFSIDLRNTDTSLAFSMMCTGLSKSKDNLMERMDSWLTQAIKRIQATKEKALIYDDHLSTLKTQAGREVRKEVNKWRSRVEADLMDEVHLKTYRDIFKPILMSDLDEFEKQVTEEITQKLERANEDHCCSVQLDKFQAALERDCDYKLRALLRKSKTTNCLPQDTELKGEFDALWNSILYNFNFRSSERDDITERVIKVLRDNLIGRGLQKHIKKLSAIGHNRADKFKVCDECYGFRSRVKHAFEDRNKQQRAEAQQLANNIIDQYNRFAAEKSRSPSDFSDSYIAELLDMVETALKEKPLEIRSAFEVKLKVYLCNAACRDFQKLHDRYGKDAEFLRCVDKTKSAHLEGFVYRFRKMDQCQRLAQTFTSAVLRPIVLNYTYEHIGMQILEEIKAEAPQLMSRKAFDQSLLEEIIREDSYESLTEYLFSYDDFRLRRIQETVVAHQFEPSDVNKWREQQLGEIMAKIEAAVSQTADETKGVLSDIRPLLDRICLALEAEGEINVPWASLGGPLFNVTAEWDHFSTCLVESLPQMRSEFAREFSKRMDMDQLLGCLPVHPKDSLFASVKGCEKQCPVCRAPCEVEIIGHEVHGALLHRPTIFSPSGSPSRISSPGHFGEDNENPDPEDITQDPGWDFSPEDHNNQEPSVYWRYVLVRFSERFAEENDQEPAEIPEEWMGITQDMALESLQDTFPLGRRP